jgi:hypothetical protein
MSIAIKGWDIDQTSTLVKTLFGKQQYLLTQPCLRSIIDRQLYVTYHYWEAERLLKAFKKKIPADKPLFVLVRNAGPTGPLFNTLMVKAGAHITASFQGQHAISDLLASGIYFACGMNLTHPLKSERDIKHESVKQIAAKEPEWKNLSRLLEQLTKPSEYKHLAAVTNRSKHRTVVRAMLSDNFTKSKAGKYEFQIEGFSDNGKEYPSLAFKELMEPETIRMAGVAIEIGHELDAVLNSRIVASMGK